MKIFDEAIGGAKFAPPIAFLIHCVLIKNEYLLPGLPQLIKGDGQKDVAFWTTSLALSERL